MTSTPAASQHLRDLAQLRRVGDRIDREHEQPLDVEALARGAHMSAGHLSREFRRAYGEPPSGYLMTRTDVPHNDAVTAPSVARRPEVIGRPEQFVRGQPVG